MRAIGVGAGSVMTRRSAMLMMSRAIVLSAAMGLGSKTEAAVKTKNQQSKKESAPGSQATLPGRLLKPRALKPGDRVGLVCPGGRPHNPATVNMAMRAIEEMGFKPVAGKSVLKIHGSMAGTDQERLDDLMSFWRDDSIQAIYSITGGYGAIHLVDKIDWDLVSQKPKLFAGTDDICHIILAAYARTGLVSLVAPNLDMLTTRDLFESVKKALTTTENFPRVTSSYQNAEHLTYKYAPVEGVVEGALVGGNLTALSSLMGTPFEPPFEGSILFLCDVNETNDILDRWFTNLYVAGALDRVKGVVIADFPNCAARDCFNLYSLEDLFGDRLKQLNKPSCFAMPIGQSSRSVPVPIGVRTKFNSADGTLDFLEPAFV